MLIARYRKSRHFLKILEKYGLRICLCVVACLASMNFYGMQTYNAITGQVANLRARAPSGNYEWSNRRVLIGSTDQKLDWGSPGKYALWTYPIEPPSSVRINDDELIVCSYRVCREFCEARKISFRSLNLAEIIPQADGLSSEQAGKFKQFVDDQYWYKIQHLLEFPHHVQSVAFLSLVAMQWKRDPQFCIRPLGHSVSFCGDDTILRNEYDPTSTDSSTNQPPYRIDGLNFNSTKFGILSFDRRVAVVQVGNSGDELQSFPGLQFMPYLSDFVDRDFGLKETHAHNLFANAWWGYPSAFPPPRNMTAAFFSVHMSGKFQNTVVPKNLGYFQRYTSQIGPIGARDSPTLAFLESLGLPTYQSSCFTQMLRPHGNKYKDTVHDRDLIMLVDVEPDLLPAHVVERGQIYMANVNSSDMNSREARLQHAQELYFRYSNKAKVVITSRIHSALPASVNGVPVIFVERSEANLPGGKGGRTKGISDLFHTYRPEDGDQWSFDLDRMPPNPGVHRQDRYRASFWNYIKKRLPSWYVDSAELFGLVPIRRLGEGVVSDTEDLHNLFHFIFTTPPETLTWRVQRAIEAVFYHHPNAKVIMHSRSLPISGTRLDAFAETGYDFAIRPYNLETLLEKSSAVSEQDRKKLLEVLEARKEGDFWYSHETDLIRLLIMEKYGGVYMDTDMHIIKPFPKSLRNVLAYQDRLTPKRALKLALVRMVNGAVMIFEKDNMFLRELVTEAMNRLIYQYNADEWGILGPQLLSDTWRTHEKKKKHDQRVQILDNTVFYPYNFGNAHGCFQDHDFFKPVTDETYAVHLNTKVTSGFQSTSKGTYCDTIFHAHCIFCDEIYTSSANTRMFFTN
jgi:hypothetical protein